MKFDRHATIVLALLAAALLLVITYRREVAAIVMSTDDNGGVVDFPSAAPAAYMGSNWGPPTFMQLMMPQTSQGGSRSPLSSNDQCGVC